MLRLLAFACALPIAAHTFHSSLAQIDYISAKKRIEIIVWIHAEDIEKVMKEKHGRNATLDNRKEAERFVRTYLQSHFEFRNDSGKPVPLTWVGLKVRTHFIAAFLATPAPEGLQNLSLANRILLDALSDQMNLVKIKLDGQERRELSFDNRKGATAQPLAVLQSR